MPEREFWEKVFLQFVADWSWTEDKDTPTDLIWFALMADAAVEQWLHRFSKEAPFE